MPRPSARPFAALLLAPFLGLLARPADAAEPFERLIAEKAGAVVSVKFVLHLSISFRGQSQDHETPGTVTGILVDPAGLVVIPSPNAQFRGPRGGMGEADVKVVPGEFQVVFPGDPKEYPAILGASDSKLGLTFVKIKDLEERACSAVDAAATVEPAVGDLCYGVSRLPQGFDYAPVCEVVRISGRVTKPRALWVVQGMGDNAGQPLYDAQGAVAGMLVRQEAVGGEAAGTFLLPWKDFAATLDRARTASEEALVEARKKEAEEAAAPPAEEPAGEEGATAPEDGAGGGETPPPGGGEEGSAAR
jgi:hypothetical protein